MLASPSSCVTVRSAGLAHAAAVMKKVTPIMSMRDTARRSVLIDVGRPVKYFNLVDIVMIRSSLFNEGAQGSLACDHLSHLFDRRVSICEIKLELKLSVVESA